MKTTLNDLRSALLCEQDRVRYLQGPRIEFPAKRFLMPDGSMAMISFGSLPVILPRVDIVGVAQVDGDTVRILGELRWRDAVWLFRMAPDGEFPSRWIVPDPGAELDVLMAMISTSLRQFRQRHAVFTPPMVGVASQGAFLGAGDGDPALDLKSRIVAALRTLGQPGLAAEAEQSLGGDYSAVLAGALGLLEQSA